MSSLTAVPGIRIEIPERGVIELRDLVCDFNGTLAFDGLLLPGVADALVLVSSRLRVTIVTADTFGTAREALADLPVDVRLTEHGEEKARLVEALGADHVVAIGNGQNDVPMFRAAVIGIAILGREGLSASAAQVASVLVPDPITALELLFHPRRLRATLRR